MRYQRREYKLVNIDNGTSIILNSTGTNNEPRGWDESDYTIKRSVKNFSITTTLSNNLEFTGAGARFLIDAYTSKGVEANVKMFETRFNPNTDAPYVFTIADFDFSEIIRTKTTVQIPFTSGGLNQLLKAKLNDKFEFTRIESITGDPITPVQTNEFAAINRPLFLDSLLNSTDQDKDNYNFRMAFADDYRYGFLSLPLSVDYDSDDSVLTVVKDQFFVIGGEYTGGVLPLEPLDDNRGQLFYYNADMDKKIKLKIDFSGFLRLVNNDDLERRHLSFRLCISDGGENPSLQIPLLSNNDTLNSPHFPDYDNFQTLLNVNQVLAGGNDTNFQFNDELEVELQQGQSVGILLFGGGNFEEFFGNSNCDVDLTNFSGSVKIEEFSVRNDLPRRSKCILNKDVGRSLMNIINNDATTYKSDFFNTGDFKLSAVTSGKWIRGFLDDSITFSGKDWFENCNSLFSMGYNIEIIDGKETLVHEELKYFFRPETKITIPQQVNNVKRSIAKDFIYSTVKSGYKKPSGDNLYEEVNGLNEYNTSNEYITPITRVVSEYDIESPFRADSEGKELTVRKSIRLFPTEDYRTDKTIFNLDLKNEGTNVLSERVWQDDYEVEPRNIFSPDTATGLRLTPYRNMERHFWFINNSLTKYPDKYIRYSSTRGNSELITKKAGEEEKKENGDFKINSLENAIFVNEWVEFEYPVDFDLISQVNGVSDVEGVRVPNLYFKVEFINEFNEKEYGYLFELQPNKEGKWKLLKAV